MYDWRCKDCGRHRQSWAHLNQCRPVPPKPDYVKCVVPGCLVYTTKPTPDGMCPMNLWSEDHDRYFIALRRAS